MTIESRPIDARSMGRAGKAVEGVMICVVVIANLDINVMIRRMY